MNSKYQHEKRARRHNKYGDIETEKYEYMEDMYDHFLMLFLLESNYDGLKMMFGVNRNNELYRDQKIWVVIYYFT